MSMMVLLGYGVYLLWKDAKDYLRKKFTQEKEDDKEYEYVTSS